jgi:hypothetical protein
MELADMELTGEGCQVIGYVKLYVRTVFMLRS